MFSNIKIVKFSMVDYQQAYELQKKFVQDHIDSKGKNTLILLQHDPVITIGRGGDKKNILVSEKFLASAGIKVYEIDRGGDVTYHGPGQLTGYPIIDLKLFKKDIYWYLRQLEEVIIKVLAEYDITGQRVEGYTGVWVGDEKICAIGIAVRRWITYHGFALNVHPNMSHFGLITPCGITDKGVTSIEKILGHKMDMDEVVDKTASAFTMVFNMD
jgi:lipoyl(octanoyl) transferase